MKFKSVFRYDKDMRLVRLFRLLWTKGTVGDGQGYSCSFSVGLQPKLFQFVKDFYGPIIVLLGLRIHYKRSYGGTIC